MQAKWYIPYNASLTEYARDNRKKSTEAEDFLRQTVLRKRQLLGYKFVRQKVIDYYILDFYCSELMLWIEVDGEYHLSQKQKIADKQRELILNDYRITILRFTNDEVLSYLDKVRKSLENYIENSKFLPW